jgi:hypothetical protein
VLFVPAVPAQAEEGGRVVKQRRRWVREFRYMMAAYMIERAFRWIPTDAPPDVWRAVARLCLELDKAE